MQVIDRAIQILTILGGGSSGKSVAELARSLNIAPSSIHRVLISLKENNFIVQDMDTKKYKIGYKVISLCNGITKESSLMTAARPIMKELAKKINKTVILCVMENGHVVNIDSIENEDSFMYMVKLGKEIPMHATSAGKVFCAYINRDDAKKYLAKASLEKTTPYTKTDLDEICKELDSIKKHGYAICDEELQIGMQGISCPIFDSRHTIVGAISFTSIKKQQSINKDTIFRLQQSAAAISKIIGCEE